MKYDNQISIIATDLVWSQNVRNLPDCNFLQIFLELLQIVLDESQSMNYQPQIRVSRVHTISQWVEEVWIYIIDNSRFQRTKLQSYSKLLSLGPLIVITMPTLKARRVWPLIRIGGGAIDSGGLSLRNSSIWLPMKTVNRRLDCLREFKCAQGIVRLAEVCYSSPAMW